MKKRIQHRTKPITIILVTLVFALVGSYLLVFSQAATANAGFSLTPSSGSYDIDSDISVQVHLDSGSQPVNAADFILTYDPSKLTLKSKNHSDSALPTCLDYPESNNNSGILSFGCSVLGSSTVGKQKIANLVFTAKVGSGSTTLQFRNDSGIYRADTNENIWSGSTSAGSFNFSTPDTTKPTVNISSPTSGQNVTGTAFPIQATAVDDSGQISKVEFWINGSKVQTITGTKSSYSYSWDTTSLSDRNGVPIEVRAYDQATPSPNMGTKSLSVNIKNSKPNLTVPQLSVSPNHIVAGDNVSISASIKNSGSDNIATSVAISNIFQLNSNTLNNPLTITGLNVNATKSISTTWTAVRGSHTISVVADQSNKVSESNESDNQKSTTIKVYKQSDANDDNKIDGADLSILSANWGKSGVDFLKGDFSGDGKVTGVDLSILSTNWSK